MSLTDTYLYVIQAEDGGPVKIGVSRNPANRLSQLQSAHHKPLRIVDSFEGSYATEKRIHERLSEKRLSGEWFEDCPELWEAVNFVRSSSKRHAEIPHLNGTLRFLFLVAMADLAGDLPPAPDEEKYASVFAAAGREYAYAVASSLKDKAA